MLRADRGRVTTRRFPASDAYQRVSAGPGLGPLQPGVGPIRSSGSHRPGVVVGPAPIPPGSTRSTGDPRGGRAGPVVVTMHRAKDLEFRRDLLPDVSEAAPAHPGALSRGVLSAARHGGLRRRRAGVVRRPTRVGLLTRTIRV